MNKKAFFLPIFIVVTLMFLSSLVFVIETTKLGRNGIIGLEAVSIIKIYDEAEKIQFYLEESAKDSSENALDELYLNAGYQNNNKCRKIPKTESEPRYIILDKTCGEFNIEENYKGLLKNNLNEYIKKYKSSYKTFNKLPVKNSKLLESLNLIPEQIEAEQGEIINSIAAKNTNNAEINSITINDNLNLEFSEIELRIEKSPESYHKFTPKVSIQKPNLEIFNSIQKAVSENCLNKEECKLNLKNTFANIEIKEQNNILKIKLPYENKQIYFALQLN